MFRVGQWTINLGIKNPWLDEIMIVVVNGYTAPWVWILPWHQVFGALRKGKNGIIFCTYDNLVSDVHSTEVAFALLTQQPRVRILAPPFLFTALFVDSKIDQIHVVLMEGILQMQGHKSIGLASVANSVTQGQKSRRLWVRNLLAFKDSYIFPFFFLIRENLNVNYIC